MAKEPKELTPFTKKVIAVIRKIPKGRVATYKQVAGLAGRIHASRAVVWILNTCSKKYELPWHRVISAQGRIAFKPKTSNFLLQKRLLRGEGVEVDVVHGDINLKKFQYKKKPQIRKQRHLPTMFD